MLWEKIINHQIIFRVGYFSYFVFLISVFIEVVYPLQFLVAFALVLVIEVVDLIFFQLVAIQYIVVLPVPFLVNIIASAYYSDIAVSSSPSNIMISLYSSDSP